MEHITLESLTNTASCTAVVAALTEVIKRYIKINPKWIALILATTIQVILCVAFGNISALAILLALANALVIAGAAVGAFETAKKTLGLCSEKTINATCSHCGADSEFTQNKKGGIEQ